MHWLTLCLATCLPASLIAEPDFAPGQLLIRFEPSADSQAIEAFTQKHDLLIEHRYRHSTTHTARGTLVLFKGGGRTMAAMRQLVANDPTIAYAEPNYTRQLSALPDDTNFGLLWGLHNTGQTVNGTSGTLGADINYPEAWKLSRTPSTEIVVAVADTGINIQHPDLMDRIWSHPAEIADNGLDDDGNGYIDDIHGYDFGTDSNAYLDNHGHGTHVSGTIGATSDNGTGITGVSGSARLIQLKIESADGKLYTSDIIEAFEYATDLKNSGVNLVAVNASFGGPSFTQAEHDAIDEMNTAGIILCASAGNDGLNNDSTSHYPANYDLPNIISVAASDQDHDLAVFSNYGNTTVDLAAPGVNIYSTLPIDQSTYTSSLNAGGNDYTTEPLEYAGTTTPSGLTAAVIACGLGYPEDFPGSVDGQIALIQRGELTFADKVSHAMAANAVGALIYNNVDPPAAAWTLGTEADWIPALQLSRSDGADILAALPLSATIHNTSDLTTAYQYLNGTSMATPHVTGAVALAALNFPNDSVSERVARILNTVTAVPTLTGQVSSGGVLNLQQLLDADSDMLADWWEADFFGNLDHDGSSDSDGDRFTDAQEFLSRTDPTSALSVFKLNSTDFDPVNGTTLQFQTAQGISYQLLWSQTLAEDSWQILQDDILGDGTTLELSDPSAVSAERRFYRLRLVD